MNGETRPNPYISRASPRALIPFTMVYPFLISSASPLPFTCRRAESWPTSLPPLLLRLVSLPSAGSGNARALARPDYWEARCRAGMSRSTSSSLIALPLSYICSLSSSFSLCTSTMSPVSPASCFILMGNLFVITLDLPRFISGCSGRRGG